MYTIFVEYNEIKWDDLNKTDKRTALARRVELAGWLIGSILVVGALFSFFPWQDLFLSQSHLEEKYGAQAYAWLNRCDRDCASKVNASYLDAQRSCNALINLSTQENTQYLYEWRLAVDDRATSLGCVGFPQTLEAIHASAAETKKTLAQAEQSGRDAEQARLDAEKEQILTRFKQSVADGQLLHLLDQAVLDSTNQNSLRVTVTEDWFQQSAALQQQVADVLWQKWAAIRSPRNPQQAELQLQTASGVILNILPAKP